MSLSPEAIDHIFKRLAVTYLAAWDRFVGATPVNDVKTIWAHDLGEFGLNNVSKRRILWALENLPERPPNAIEFKRLCRQAPMMPDAALPPPAPLNIERINAELSKLGQLKVELSSKPLPGRLDWAHRLKEKDRLNPKLVTPTVRMMYREALKLES